MLCLLSHKKSSQTELQNVNFFKQSKNFKQILPQEKCVNRNRFVLKFYRIDIKTTCGEQIMNIPLHMAGLKTDLHGCY